ncbi:MAG: DUF1580 domain-containing protein [Planctomycetota bacterium]
MIDTKTESLAPLHEAPHEIPGRPHISTVVRWRLRGVRGVKLETTLIGGRRYTSREALDRLFTATTSAAGGKTPPARVSKDRERAIKDAERELEEAGI